MEIPKTRIHYRLDLSGPKKGELGVGMTVDLPTDQPLDLVMPRLSPGSPTKSLHHESRLGQVRAVDPKGNELPIAEQDDGSLRVIRNGAGPVTVNYTVKADEFSHVRNQVTEDYGYISGAASMMYVKGHDTDVPSTVELTNLPKSDWKSLSTLAQVKAMPHAYWANSYQDIADTNIFAGKLNTVEDRVGGTDLVVNVHGDAPWESLQVNGATAAETMQDLKAAYTVFTDNFGEFSLERVKEASPRPDGVDPNDKYVLNKHYLENGSGYSGGFEHYHGHELILDKKAEKNIEKKFNSNGRDFERGILVHELVHKMLAKYVTHDGIDSEDLSKIGKTDGLWVTEGFTDWTASVLERQAGMLNFDQYGQVLEGFFDRYSRNMAVRASSPTEDSLEAHQGNSNYYNKGSVAASLLDLELRHHTGNSKGLFHVIRDLKDEFGGTGRGHTLEDMERLTLRQVEGNQEGTEAIKTFYDRHLRSAEPMDINQSLAHVGYQMKASPKSTEPFSVVGPDGKALNVNGDWQISQGPPAYPAKKKVFMASLGLSLGKGDTGLEVSRIRKGGPGAKAGLEAFEGRTVESLAVNPENGAVKFSFAATETQSAGEVSVMPERPEELKLVPVSEPTGEQLALRHLWQQGKTA